jgi:putative peptide zinc metalloprotease protein
VRPTRRTLILLALLIALLGAWARPPTASAQDNTAVAVNTKDGTAVFKLAFKITRVTGEVVDNTNAAVAFASCTDCQAIAVAFQIVLVTSDPAVVTPVNLALAVNYECTSCIAFASAYQWVLGTGGPVRFSQEGMMRLTAIRKRLHDLRKADLTLEQLLAELEAIRADIADILTTELIPAGKPSGDEGAEPATTTTEADTRATSTEPTTTAETTTEPTTTTTP